METMTIEKNIKVYFVNAKTFPEDILTAHQTLHSIIPFSTGRRYFGLSRPEGMDYVIAYKAAVEQIDDDLERDFHLETMEIESGIYNCITVRNYAQDLQSISKAFQELTAIPTIDPNGYCVEWYYNEKDVKCLVRILD